MTKYRFHLSDKKITSYHNRSQDPNKYSPSGKPQGFWYSII